MASSGQTALAVAEAAEDAAETTEATERDPRLWDVGAPVTLHIYDMGASPTVGHVNGILGAIGAGAYHAAAEVYGSEWTFGYALEGTGVYSCLPTRCAHHKYRTAIPMGHTYFTKRRFARLIGAMEREWLGSDYDLLRRNCCHFSETICQRLGLGAIPRWVMSLASAGALLSDGAEATARNAGAAAQELITRAVEVDARYQLRGAAEAGARELMATAEQIDEDLRLRERVADVARGALATAGGALATAGAIDGELGVTQAVINSLSKALATAASLDEQLGLSSTAKTAGEAVGDLLGLGTFELVFGATRDLPPEAV